MVEVHSGFDRRKICQEVREGRREEGKEKGESSYLMSSNNGGSLTISQFKPNIGKQRAVHESILGISVLIVAYILPLTPKEFLPPLAVFIYRVVRVYEQLWA
jgi:hypothetical protein